MNNFFFFFLKQEFKILIDIMIFFSGKVLYFVMKQTIKIDFETMSIKKVITTKTAMKNRK